MRQKTIQRLLAEQLIKEAAVRPLYRAIAGGGIGAGLGYLRGNTPEERASSMMSYGLLGAGGGALTSRAARQSLARMARKQKYGYTGSIPKKLPKLAPTTGKGQRADYLAYLNKLDPNKASNELIEPGKGRRLLDWFGNVYRGARGKALKHTPAKTEAQTARDALNKLIEADRTGMSSLRGMAGAIKRDPRAAAKNWYRYGGKRELMWAPVWGATSIPDINAAEPGKGRAGAIGQAIGSTAGWAAVGGLPLSVSLPTSMLAGTAGKAVGRLMGKRQNLAQQNSLVTPQRLNYLRDA